MIINLFWKCKASQQHCWNVLDLHKVLTDMSRNTSFEEAPFHMTNVGQYSWVLLQRLQFVIITFATNSVYNNCPHIHCCHKCDKTCENCIKHIYNNFPHIYCVIKEKCIKQFSNGMDWFQCLSNMSLNQMNKVHVINPLKHGFQQQ